MFDAQEARNVMNNSQYNVLECWFNDHIEGLIRVAAQVCKSEIRIPTYNLPQDIMWQTVADYLHTLGYKTTYKAGYDNGQFDNEPDTLIVSWK